ncbi:UDP-N-acetyl-D-mannosamine dehydrogenase [Actinomyces mediterranea]|uniref:UDP-N-acetyl-D-mannosamine dehydrogenase n=1 Tax=Actinomyces mediterranea TaxID=1871028 RepID=UPI000970FFA9|nr:UDP-N-acetyl-D-mannosamine dehydrogenase [Actinomyces mediterranea]
MSSSEPLRALPQGRLVVVGLGYIGLPTAVVFAQAGWSVLGVDVSENVVASINYGSLPFVEAGLEEALAGVVRSGAFRASTRPEPADVFIVSVPTPFTGEHTVDMSYINAAAESIAPILAGGELVVLESTVPPGTTEMMAHKILAERPDLSMDPAHPGALFFAHAPERVLPGRILAELTTNDRIVGGLGDEAGVRAQAVYQSFCTGTVSVTGAATAELTKLAENSFRDVNIAFANELSLICDDLGINVWDVIELANRHPRVSILQPGPGVGGHCIAVDPWFIVSAAPSRVRLIRTAREVNDSMPARVIEQIRAAVDVLGLDKPKIALLGLAFKPDIDDLRESPSVGIALELATSNPTMEVLAVEPHITHLPTAFAAMTNVRLVTLDDAVERADIIVLLVDHRQFRRTDPAIFGDRPIIDTKGLWRRTAGGAS